MGPEAPRFPFVSLDVAPDDADEVSYLLFDLGAQGVEQRDEGTLIAGPGGELVTLVASFTDHAAAHAAIEQLSENAAWNPRLEEVVGDEWRDAWKEHFRPFHLTDDIAVVAPWHEPSSDRPEAEHTLTLEPGRAFGTGLHATTSLVAAMLAEQRAKLSGQAVLDAGTGSGILAFVALLYGAKHVVAFDIDPDVIETVQENADRNGMSDSVRAFAGTIELVKESFPWVLANIEARVLIPLADEFRRVTDKGGTLVLSGVLVAQQDAVRDAFEKAGFTWVEATRAERGPDERDVLSPSSERDEWVAILMRG